MDINEISLRLKTFGQRNLEDELEFLTNIRDNIELYTTDGQTYSAFLSQCLEGIKSILLFKDKFRKQEYRKSSVVCMEILTLLPHNEIILNYCLDLAQLCLHILDREMDDIGVLAIRNLVFLHKNFTEKLEFMVESFLGFSSRLCNDIQHNLPHLIQEIILSRNNNSQGQDLHGINNRNSNKSDTAGVSHEDSDQSLFRGNLPSSLSDFSELTNPVRSTVNRSSLTSGVGSNNSVSIVALPCNRSLRILTELPLALLHIFQLYPHYIERYFAIFAPNLISCLNMASIFPREFHPKLPGSSYTSYNHSANQHFQINFEQVMDIISKPSYKSFVQEYMVACSKIALWFIHFFRTLNTDDRLSEALRQILPGFTQGFIEILLLCPPYCIQQRREILVCLRSILSTDIRQSFYDKSDILLDETVLIGHGRTGYETVKVISSAIIHEMLVYLRIEYSNSFFNNINQESLFDSILKCLHSLTRNILDISLPLPAQHYCIRSLAFIPDVLKKEGLISNNNPQKNIIIRDVLLKILWTFSMKLHQLRRQIYNLIIISLGKELPDVHLPRNDLFAPAFTKPTLKEFLDEFNEISNVGNWLENSFSYYNTQIGNCEISLLGYALPHGIDSAFGGSNQSGPLVIDVLRELRPIIRATIIGARQTVFHITTLNNRGLSSSSGYTGNFNNKTFINTNSSGVHNTTNTVNMDITRYDVRKLSSGLMLSEKESKLLQKILIEGIICSIEYCTSFQYTMSTSNLFHIKEGGDECSIIPTSSLIISNNPQNQTNQNSVNSSIGYSSANTAGSKFQHFSPLSILPEERELLELLASTLCYIHPQSFGDIIQATFPLLFDWSTKISPQIALIFHYWGLQHHISRVFYESILPYLTSKLVSLSVEPESEFKTLRKNSSSLDIMLTSLKKIQESFESISQHDFSSIIAQANSLSSAPLTFSVYPIEYERFAPSRHVIDHHIDLVEQHKNIPFSRGRISNFGNPIPLTDTGFSIVNPNDDPYGLSKFSPTTAPHGNPEGNPFSFDVLTQNVNVSFLQINNDFTDLPIPDTFIYSDKKYEICDNDSSVITSGLVITRLFKQIFRYIGQNPQFEVIIIPHIVDLCTLCISMASKYQHNIFFLSILRSLFRSITPGGKASGIYREFLKILPWFLETAIKMHKITKSPFREIWLEISLTVPARLKSLLPYMGELIGPMINALESNDPELVLLALRSLDLWIDNLHHDFLYPILTNIIYQSHRFQTRPSIIVILCKLLRPAPPIPLPITQLLFNNYPRFQKNNSFSHYTLQSIAFQHATVVGRVLGKLGGKNRWFLKDFPILDSGKANSVDIPVTIDLYPYKQDEKPVIFKLDDILQHVYQYLSSILKHDSSSSITQITKNITKCHIKHLILIYLSIFWNETCFVDDVNVYFDFLGSYLQDNFEQIENPAMKTLFSMDYLSLSSVSVIPSYFNNIELLTRVIILASSVVEEFSPIIGKYCEGLTTFLAIYSASRSFIPEYSTLNFYWSSFNTDPVAPVLSGLFETIQVQYAVTPNEKNERGFESPELISLEAIKNLLSTYYSLVKRFPSFYTKRALQTAQLPTLLSSNIVALCYETSREKKTAASLLIIEILNCIPPDWSQLYFTKLLDALFFVSKDSDTDSNSFGERCSEDALECLIYSVFSGVKPRAILNRSSISNNSFSLPQTKHGNTITNSKISTISGEQINSSGNNWDDFIKMVADTNELMKNNPDLWWNGSFRVYMEMLIFESKNSWFSGSLDREGIFNLLGECTPSEEVLHMLRGHLNHLFVNSIVPNILSLSPSCRRMAKKCLTSLSSVTGVSVAVLLNIAFNNSDDIPQGDSPTSVQTTLLQLLISRLQTKLISTCSIPYQLAFLDALCFITSLRPAPIGIHSGIIKRFVEDIIVLIQDEIDMETNENQRATSNTQNQLNMQCTNGQNMFSKNNPDVLNNKIKVQIYSIKFLKLILIHPIWSEFLRNRYQISSHNSSNISHIVSPIIQTNSPTQMNQNNKYQQGSINQNSHLTHNVVQPFQQIQNLPQNMNINNQGIHSISQSKTHFSHQVYQNQYNININQGYPCENQINQHTQSKPIFEELRWKIIGVLLRCVTRKDLEICKAAHHALRVIVRIERFVLNSRAHLSDYSGDAVEMVNIQTNDHYELLPEDQLRYCLRPVLVQLASATRLTVPLLQGLARLLELLCFCFNVTLGEKLLQHLQKLCWPSDFQQRDHYNVSNYSSSRQIPNSSGFIINQYETVNRHEEDLQMAITMVCIFHLLPQGSDEFVAKVIGTVLGTRSFPGIDGTANGQSSVYSFITSYVTNMTISSPFRLPLALFATHSPHNVVIFLLQQLSSDRYADFLIDLIRISPCSVVRVKLYQYRTQLIDATLNKVLKETEYFETKRDTSIKSIGQGQMNNSLIQANTVSKTHGMTQNINKKLTYSVPVSPAYTEIYSSAWNGIRVLSNFCEEWPSLLIIDFLEYYSSTNKSNLTIVDALLTLYNTIFNRLIVLSRTGGILTNGNYDNKFELSLGYQGSVTWQHPWSFFHSNECFLLFKMLIGFYTATNTLNNHSSINLNVDKNETCLGKEVITDIDSVMKNMKSVLINSIHSSDNSPTGTLSNSSPISYQGQCVNESDYIFSGNNYTFGLSQIGSLNQCADNGINMINSHSSNDSQINNGSSQVLYPSKELIYSLLLTTKNVDEVQEHLKRRRIDVVLTIATLFGTSTTVDTGPLRDFLILTVPRTLTTQEKRLLFNQLIQRYYPNNSNFDAYTILPGTQLACIQLILIPLIEFEFNIIEGNANEYSLENSWLSEDIYEGIILRVILPTLERGIIPLHGTFGLSAVDDVLKIEALKLLIIIIKNNYFDDTLTNNRKRVIKNVWNILRTESSLLKSWGYIAMCYFVKRYPFPDKILFSMLISLIRLYSISEVRMTVRRALCIFIPILYSIRPISYEDCYSNLSSHNRNNRNIFSLVTSPPKLSIKDRTPEQLFSNWIRLMVAILIQDSCNLPLQQQLYHWNIINSHPDIFSYESVYLLSPIISTITKLMWGYYPINPNFNHNYISTTPLINQNCGYSGQCTNSQYSLPTSTNVPFLPEIKRNIFDVMLVITCWVCGNNEIINSDSSDNRSFCNMELADKKKKLSSESSPRDNSRNDVKSYNNNYMDFSIDISSIPYLSSLLDTCNNKCIPLIDLIITLWFRLALLSSNSDHQMVAKSFNIISKVLKTNSSCKVQYNWLDLGYSCTSSTANNGAQSRINVQNQVNLSSGSNNISYSSQMANSNHIAFHLTIIAGIQVIIKHQAPSVLVTQLDSILQILESSIISNERIITDSFYSLICKLLQIIPRPSKQLQQLLNESIQTTYTNIDDSNKLENIKRKEFEYSYIKNYKISLTKKFRPDNKVDSFYIKLLEISVYGIWLIVSDFSISPEPKPVKYMGKNKEIFDRFVSFERDQNLTFPMDTNSKFYKSISLYTSFKITQSLLAYGIYNGYNQVDEFTHEDKYKDGILFLKYLSPLIIYTLNRILQLISVNINTQNAFNVYSNSIITKQSNAKGQVFINPKLNNSINCNTAQLQNSSNIQNISTLNICCEFLQILFISPSVTMEIIENNLLREYSIQLLRDFGLTNFQGGVVHNLVSIIGRWLFQTHIDLNSYLFEKLNLKLDENSCFKPQISEQFSTECSFKLELEDLKFPKVFNLDDILGYYCMVKKQSKEVNVLNYELIIILITSWSLICDRNRKYEVHLVYHLFVMELLDKEEVFLDLKTEICDKISCMNTEGINMNIESYNEADYLFSSCRVISYLEKCALLSLASPHPKIKDSILTWFNKKLPSDIMGRLHYLFTSPSFDILAERFYITEFLELIVPSLKLDKSIPINKMGGFATILPTLEQGTVMKLRSKYFNKDLNQLKKDQDDINDELDLWEINNSFFGNFINYKLENRESGVSLINLLEDYDNKEELLKKINISSTEKVLNEDKYKHVSIVNEFVRNIKDHSSLVLELFLFFSKTDENIAIATWKTIFPFIWDNLVIKQKDSLTKDIIDLLSKERHHRISSSMPSEWTIPNVILEGLIICESPPILPSSLLLHLSTKLRCWHVAGEYLKNQMHYKHTLSFKVEDSKYLFCNSNIDCREGIHHLFNNNVPDNSWMILAEIYSELQEEDIVIGIRRAHSNCIETHAGLALMQQAEWSKAQEIFYNNLDRIYCLSFPFEDKEVKDWNNRILCWYNLVDTSKPSLLNNELVIWIDSWVACAKHLNQWNTLNEFAKERKNPQLQLECSSKLQDWTLVEKLVNKYILHNPVTKLCQAYHSLYDLLLGAVNNNSNFHTSQEQNIYANLNNSNRNFNSGSGSSVYNQSIQTFALQNNISKSKLSEFERHCSVGYKTVLNFWAMLPGVVSVCHIPLLLNFQQYVELQEGFRLSSDIDRKLNHDNNPNHILNGVNIHNNIGLGTNLHLQNNVLFPYNSIPNTNISMPNGTINLVGNYSVSQGVSSTSTPGYFEARMLNVWRDRLPNKWDSMILWNDLFVWRNFVFSIIMNLINRSEYLSINAKSLWPGYLQDMPWTMIKFASIARKSHRLPEVSVALLQRLQNHLQLSGGDAYRAETFLATIEKVKLCISDSSQLKTGLNILNMTDFQKSPEPYFDEYRAELLRLKGIILNKLYPSFYIEGDIHNSTNFIFGHSTFNLDNNLQNVNNSITPNICPPMVRPNTDLLSSLKVYPLFARGWITWAQYTDRLLYIHQNMSYAVNAVISYLIGIYLRPDKYSILLSRILWLLPHDSPEGKYLSLAFIKYSDFLPCAVWLPWIPQLIAGLDRIEGNALMHVFNKIITLFPQSIYFNIRTVYLEKREIGGMYWYLCSNTEFEDNTAQSQAPPPSSGIYPNFISLGWQRIETIMNNCRQKHGALTLALEHWVEDLILNCKPDPLDELLCAIRTLFQMTVDILPYYKFCSSWENYCDYEDVDNPDFLPRVGLQFLEQNIVKRYEQLLSSSSTKINNKSFERSKNIIKQFWNEFKNDFNVYKCKESSTCKVPSNLKVDYVLNKLKKWKDYFTKCTEKCSNDNFGDNSLLSDLSSTLCDLFHRINIRIEVPGQNLRIASENLYLRNFAVLENSNNNNPIGGVVYLDRPLPIIETVIRQSYTLKRIGFITSNGGTIHFLIQPYSGLQQKVEERILHLQVALNSLLYKYKETRSRSISFTIQVCIPLHPRCRIVEDSEKKSIVELVEEEAVINNNSSRDLDIPVLIHRKLLNIYGKRVSEELRDESHQNDLVEIYNEICDNWVSECLLRSNLLKRFRSHDQSFTFVKQFTTQIGILSIFSYILGVSEVTPNKLFLYVDTGQVYQSELKSSYVSSTLIVEKTEKVPFRLTRNIENLMGPFGKVGVLPGSMLAFVHCLQKYEFHVRNLLCSLIRDDLYTFSMHRAIQVAQTRSKETDKAVFGKFDSFMQYNLKQSFDESAQNSISYLMNERLLSNIEIKEKVDRNVRRMMEKIAILTNPRPSNGKSVPIDKSILELIECSTNEDNLSVMKPTWMPWL